MPFRSVAQRRFLWANHPDIARRWTAEHGSTIQKKGVKNMKHLKFPAQGKDMKKALRKPSTLAYKKRVNDHDADDMPMAKKKTKKKASGAIKHTGSFGGKSNALGHGGRAAQMRARGVPGGVIGEIARREGAAPGQPNYHGGKKSKAPSKAKKSKK
jgi:hypothetical protein